MNRYRIFSTENNTTEINIGQAVDAIKEGNITRLKRMLENSQRLTGKEILGNNTLLYIALNSPKNVEAVELLLAHGANPNYLETSFPVLRALASFNYPNKQQLFEILLRAGADINIQHGTFPPGSRGSSITPLMHAGFAGDLELVRFIYCHGGRIPVSKQGAFNAVLADSKDARHKNILNFLENPNVDLVEPTITLPAQQINNFVNQLHNLYYNLTQAGDPGTSYQALIQAIDPSVDERAFAALLANPNHQPLKDILQSVIRMQGSTANIEFNGNLESLHGLKSWLNECGIPNVNIVNIRPNVNILTFHLNEASIRAIETTAQNIYQQSMSVNRLTR